MKLWWVKGRGYAWAGPVVIWEVKLCKVCRQGKYASTRAVCWIVRGGKVKKISSRLAKRGADGLWRGVDGRTTGVLNTSYEDHPILRPVTKKPELGCECVSKSGRIPKRLVDRYLSSATPAPFTPNILEGTGTLPDISAGDSAGTSDSSGSSTGDAAISADSSPGRSNEKHSGRRRNRPVERPRRQFLPFAESGHAAAAQEIADKERANIIARLEAEALAQEELDNDISYRRTG